MKRTAYSICASLFKQDSPIDQMAYKECVEQEKRTGSSNPYAICAWRVGKRPQGAPAAKTEGKKDDPDLICSDKPKAEMKKQERELDWGHWGGPKRETVSLIDEVSRNPAEKMKNKEGDKKEEAVYGDFAKVFQGPWENSPKMIRKVPKMKPPQRPTGADTSRITPKTTSTADGDKGPKANFKKPLTMKSENAIQELQPGMSFAQLKKMEDDLLRKDRK